MNSPDFSSENYTFALGIGTAFRFAPSPRRPLAGSFSYFLRERTYCQANFLNAGVLSWELIEPQIAQLFGNYSFSDLNVSLAVSVIDLKQGKNILVQTGKLNDCLKASMAFPGILPPVPVGDMELVSSTIFCDLPLDNIEKNDAPVLAVDMPIPFIGDNPRTLLEVISIVDDISSRAIKAKYWPAPIIVCAWKEWENSAGVIITRYPRLLNRPALTPTGCSKRPNCREELPKLIRTR